MRDIFKTIMKHLYIYETFSTFIEPHIHAATIIVSYHNISNMSDKFIFNLLTNVVAELFIKITHFFTGHSFAIFNKCSWPLNT